MGWSNAGALDLVFLIGDWDRSGKERYGSHAHALMHALIVRAGRRGRPPEHGTRGRGVACKCAFHKLNARALVTLVERAPVAQCAPPIHHPDKHPPTRAISTIETCHFCSTIRFYSPKRLRNES